MADERPPPTGQEGRLDAAIAAYVQAIEAGQGPDRDELPRRHPDFPHDFRTFFDNHDGRAPGQLTRLQRRNQQGSESLLHETVRQKPTPIRPVGRSKVHVLHRLSFTHKSR
jgi:hypothetical protein